MSFFIDDKEDKTFSLRDLRIQRNVKDIDCYSEN